jgi:glyoxylate reductase
VTTTVVSSALPEGALDALVAAGHRLVPLHGGEGLAEAVGEADALVSLLTDRIGRAVLAGAPRLQVVANVAVGHDNVDVAAADELGIVVTNTPGVLDESTADLAFALALMARRATSDAERALRRGEWGGWAMDGFLGHDLHGATLGVVGWGRIGRAVARRAAAFGMEVLHTRRRPTGEAGEVALDDLLARSDVVSLHVPLTEETRHLIDAGALARMRSTSVLVNTSRGAVVDEAALAQALHAGTIFGAGLDVYEDEPAVHPRLLAAPRAVLLPHVGSATVATRTAMARLAAGSVLTVLDGRAPDNAVGRTRRPHRPDPGGPCR